MEQRPSNTKSSAILGQAAPKLWNIILIVAGILGIVIGGGAIGFWAYTPGPLPAEDQLNPSLKDEQFPRLQGQDLTGRQVVFPDSVKGAPALLIVAFRQQTQPQVDTWLQAASDSASLQPPAKLQVYEVPMIATAYKPIKGIIDKGMRSGIAKPQHDNVVTYFGPLQRYYKAFGVKDKNSCYSFLLDRDGTVRFQAEGPTTEAKLNRLQAAFQKLP